MKGTPAVAALMLIVTGVSAGCKIATVRRLDDPGQPGASTPLGAVGSDVGGPEVGADTGRPFDPAAVVDAAWDAEVIPAITRARAVSGLAPEEGIGQPVVVHGQGRVVDSNLRSRAGTATVELEGGARVVVQVGPVLTGTAIRDALPVFGFDRFVNQLQHADVGNELNERVERVLQRLDRTTIRGAYLSFAGMARRDEGGLVTITPVRLELQEHP
jgi:predicted lipoprotein